MAAPDTALIKAWCRIDDDAFDAILAPLIAAATAMAQDFTGVDYAVDTMPEAVQMWVCVHVKYWLDNPDDSRDKPLQNVNMLIQPYRSYAW